MQPSPIPPGYEGVTPYLIVSDAEAAIDFYTRAFGARELFRLPSPSGKIGHAEMAIGTARFMMASEFPEHGARSPKTLGGSPVGLLLYVEDVDARFAQALAAGGRELQPLRNQFYGDRSGTIEDPFGHKWTLATRVEDVSPEEMRARCDRMFQSKPGPAQQAQQ